MSTPEWRVAITTCTTSGSDRMRGGISRGVVVYALLALAGCGEPANQPPAYAKRDDAAQWGLRALREVVRRGYGTYLGFPTRGGAEHAVLHDGWPVFPINLAALRQYSDGKLDTLFAAPERTRYVYPVFLGDEPRCAISVEMRSEGWRLVGLQPWRSGRPSPLGAPGVREVDVPALGLEFVAYDSLGTWMMASLESLGPFTGRVPLPAERAFALLHELAIAVPPLPNAP